MHIPTQSPNGSKHHISQSLPKLLRVENTPHTMTDMPLLMRAHPECRTVCVSSTAGFGQFEHVCV